MMGQGGQPMMGPGGQPMMGQGGQQQFPGQQSPGTASQPIMGGQQPMMGQQGPGTASQPIMPRRASVNGGMPGAAQQQQFPGQQMPAGPGQSQSSYPGPSPSQPLKQVPPVSGLPQTRPPVSPLWQLQQDGASDRCSNSEAPSEVQTPRSSMRMSASPSVSSYSQGILSGGLVAGYPGLIETYSTTESTTGSTRSMTKQYSSSRSNNPLDELPRFGSEYDFDMKAKNFPSRDGEPPPAKGSVQAIMQDFVRSMMKAKIETTSELVMLGDCNSSLSTSDIRQAWAHGVSGAARGRSGLATPVEGGPDMLGSLSGISLLSGTGLRTPRLSSRGVSRDASTRSLKAAAMAVVGHGQTGLRSGLLSGKNTPRISSGQYTPRGGDLTPRSARGSTPGTPRQAYQNDIGSTTPRSGMLMAPWQQYNSEGSSTPRPAGVV